MAILTEKLKIFANLAMRFLIPLSLVASVVFFTSACSLYAEVRDTKEQSSQSILAACDEDTTLAGDCKATTGQVVTSTLGVSVTSHTNLGATTTVTAVIPDGYYQSQTCSLTEPDLIASNIKSGALIFGVNGSLIEAYAACTDDAQNATQCSTQANRYVYTTQNGGRSASCSAGSNAAACWTNAINQYVTGTLGSNIIGTNGSLSATITTAYYDGSQTATMSDTNLLNTNIKNGVTIFGITGNYLGAGTFAAQMASTQHRDKTQSQVTLETEAITNAGSAYTNSPSGYRAVPDILKDDDGYAGTSNTPVDRTTGFNGANAWAANTCGMAQATIALRIADCAQALKFGASATWDGATKGNAGQGVWKLVTRSGDFAGGKGKEVWQDQRTGLVWSSIVATAINWCKASGSNFITNNPTAQDDPSNYCDNVSYQTIGTWSPGTNRAISACFEDIDDNGVSDYFTTTDGAIDNAGKAGLNLASTPTVAWRLPTMYDQKTADTNGIRFVFPDALTNGYIEWSSSIFSSNRFSAWFFSSFNGYVNGDVRNVTYAVRCVGR